MVSICRNFTIFIVKIQDMEVIVRTNSIPLQFLKPLASLQSHTCVAAVRHDFG